MSAGQLTRGRASGEGRLADLYPDEPETPHGGRTGTPSARTRARYAVRMAGYAALPRCRCGLLLPCNDCLPTSAVEHVERRMYAGSDPVLRPDVAGTSTVRMQTGRNKWLLEHDRRAGYVVPREGR